jgi:chloramphenicol O-acetyltransferase type A
MKHIPINDPHEKKHFDFFNRMAYPHFGLTAGTDITSLIKYTKDHGLHFSSVIIYLVSRVANDLPEFRRRIRGEMVVEHDIVHPSFSVSTEASKVFSFCYVDYSTDFGVFSSDVELEIQKMQHTPKFEDTPGRDDYLFLSAIPWVHFTGFQHPVKVRNVDSVPRIVWGKYKEIGGRLVLPLGVQAHHAVVDGLHMGQYFELFQSLANQPEKLLAFQ